MNIRSTTNVALLSALVVQLGCASNFGHRYYEGAELACEECQSGLDAGPETGIVPPHSRFHPVPTRPVFAPQPEVVTMASHSVLVSPQVAESRQAEDGTKPARHATKAPTLARLVGNLPAADETEDSATKPVVSINSSAAITTGNSSRRVARNEDGGETNNEGNSTQQLTNSSAAVSSSPRAQTPPTPEPRWTDRINTNDGWRPRVR